MVVGFITILVISTYHH